MIAKSGDKPTNNSSSLSEVGCHPARPQGDDGHKLELPGGAQLAKLAQEVSVQLTCRD